MKSTEKSLGKLGMLRLALERADAVVIGGGAGLSAAAGFTYDGERFKQYFADFAKKYGFENMYSGGFYPYSSLEEYWAFWSVQITVNRYMDPPRPVYEKLLEVIKEKIYFIITTNVDHCFQKAGFNKEQLFYTQGDFGLFQCSGPCRQETFDNETAIQAMLEQQNNLKIPSSLVPFCPFCGRPMTTNLRIDNKFVEDEGWHRASERYANFLQEHHGARILFLELGVGYNTPAIIKCPFWKMTANNPNAVYACINNGEAICPSEIKDQAICINSDIEDVINSLINK